MAWPCRSPARDRRRRNRNSQSRRASFAPHAGKEPSCRFPSDRQSPAGARSQSAPPATQQHEQQRHQCDQGQAESLLASCVHGRHCNHQNPETGLSAASLGVEVFANAGEGACAPDPELQNVKLLSAETSPTAGNGCQPRSNTSSTSLKPTSTLLSCAGTAFASNCRCSLFKFWWRCWSARVTWSHAKSCGNAFGRKTRSLISTMV